MTDQSIVLITGGAGYIGSRLVPKLLAAGYRVRVLDAEYFINGLVPWVAHPRFEFIKGDIRDRAAIDAALSGVTTVVHLAAVANDPSFACDPEVSRSINIDCLPHLIRNAKHSGCKRFIYASSASVYGISDEPNVDEHQPCVPITDYNRYKSEGESILFDLTGRAFETVAVRAATVCGWSPRQRLDLTVNILTASALAQREITVFGGAQYRPNIHIDDLCRLYTMLVRCDSLGQLCGCAVNAGADNRTICDIAVEVKHIVECYFGVCIPIRTTASDDVRSYRLDSALVQRALGFKFVYTVRDAVLEICERYQSGWFGDSTDILTDPRYHNVRNMQCSDWSFSSVERRSC